MKIVKFCFIFPFYLFNNKTSAVTNLNFLNSDNNFVALYLIADLVSYSCSSGLQKFDISTL